MPPLSITLAVFVFASFNLPVLAILVGLPLIADLGQALKEKTAIGGASDTTSYSRVTCLVGAVVLTVFFWAIGNVVLWKAFTEVADIKPIIDGAWRFFLVGSALFLPYAFNQIKSAADASRVASIAAVDATITGPTPVRPKAQALNLVLANLSTSIDDAAFATAVSAIGLQVSRDFQPEWGSGAQLKPVRLSLNGGSANIDGATDAIIYLGESSSDPTSGVSGVYGYHAVNYAQLPYAFVYLDVCAQYGEVWSTTLSHEVLELVADPTAVLTVNGPAPASVTPSGKTVSYDLEVCDPTQGDAYKINNVSVSNFVTKGYFGMTGGSPATNFLKLPLSVFGVRSGGYCQYEDSAGAHQINGEKVDARKLAARAMLANHRRNARREANLQQRA